jgi:hypothetical protein
VAIVPEFAIRAIKATTRVARAIARATNIAIVAIVRASRTIVKATGFATRLAIAIVRAPKPSIRPIRSEVKPIRPIIARASTRPIRLTI